MLKHVFAAAAFAACLAAPAEAQNAPLPAVDTMTCDQMNAEMMTAGMQMNAQLDHEGLAADAQTQQDAMNQARNQGLVTGGAATAACMIPAWATPVSPRNKHKLRVRSSRRRKTKRS